MAEHSDGSAKNTIVDGRIQKNKLPRTPLSRIRRGGGVRPVDPTNDGGGGGRPQRPTATTSSLNSKTVITESSQKKGDKAAKVTTTSVRATGVPHLGFDQAEMVSHLRRLTEEHSKLQAEYARVRMLLQEACSKFSSGGPSSPVPTDGVEENRNVTPAPDVDHSEEMASSALESEKTTAALVDDEDFEASDSCKELFRREILRLKEELLSTQQQLSSAVEEKTAWFEELTEMQNRRNDLEQQLHNRDLLIEQLSAQVEHLNERLHEKTSKLHQTREEGKELQSVIVQRLKEVEQEARETKEFMQEENNSLAETLREVEEKASYYSIECEKLHYTLETKDKHCQVLSQVLEQTQTQLQLLQSELTDTQDGARELLLKQGSEINSCSVAIRRLHQLAESMSENILRNAEVSGIDICSTTGKSKHGRRSSDGRKLVHAILEAARLGNSTEEKEQTVKVASESDPIVDNHEKPECDDNINNKPESVEPGSNTLATQVKEVESDILKLDQIQHTVCQYLLGSLKDAENIRFILEEDLSNERKRLEELQTELEDNCKRRWVLEEKNRELSKEFDETKDKLREAQESLKGVWDKVNERASSLIDNKKLKQELTSLKKQNAMLNEQNSLLLNQLKETLDKLDAAGAIPRTQSQFEKCGIIPAETDFPAEQRERCTDDIEKQLALKREILHLQQMLVAKEEDLNEEKQTHERRYRLASENLRKAELEVLKLDASIEHVLEVLGAAPDLSVHPVLQQLWLDLDGPTFSNEFRNQNARHESEETAQPSITDIPIAD